MMHGILVINHDFESPVTRWASLAALSQLFLHHFRIRRIWFLLRQHVSHSFVQEDLQKISSCPNLALLILMTALCWYALSDTTLLRALALFVPLASMLLITLIIKLINSLNFTFRVWKLSLDSHVAPKCGKGPWRLSLVSVQWWMF